MALINETIAQQQVGLTTKKILLICVTAISVGMFFVSGYFVYPVPGGDTSTYTQAAVNLARNGKLSTPFLEDTYLDRIDPSGARRFLLHPPLFQVILGNVLKATTPYKAFMYIALINILTTLLFAATMYRVMTRLYQSPSWKNVTALSLAILVFVAYLIGNAGRQETIPHLLYTIGLASMLFLDLKYVWIVLGLLLGIVGATHPVAAVFFALIIGLFFTIKFNVRLSLIYIGLSYLVSIIVFLVLISHMPFPMMDIIHGVTNQTGFIAGSVSSMSIVNYIKTNFVHAYITDSSTPFLGAVLLLVLICGFSQLRRRIREHNNILIYLFVALITAVVAFVFYRASVYYNYFVIVPFGLFLLLRAVAETRSRIVTGIVIFTLCITSIGLVRHAVLFKFFLEDGMSLEQARGRFVELEKSLAPSTHFVVSDPLWVISEDYSRMSSSIPRALQGAPFVLVAQENYGGTSYAAPTRSIGDYTCVLKDDFFTNKQPSLFGIKIANTTPGYAFAAYACRVPPRAPTSQVH